MKVLYENIPFKEEYLNKYPENKDESFFCDINDSLLEKIQTDKTIYKTTEEVYEMVQEPYIREVLPNGCTFVYDNLQERYIFNMYFTSEEAEAFRKNFKDNLVRSRVSLKLSVDSRFILDIPEEETCTIYWSKVLTVKN